MADVQTSSSSSQAHRSRSRSRKRTSIDMTAMVDVAFLLLTFFVLTATLQKHSVMKMTLPPEKAEPGDFIESKIMTKVLDSADRIQYFVGMTDAEAKSCDFVQVREVIQEFIYTQQPLCRDAKRNGISLDQCWDPIFLIKAKSTSSYKNLVDILDEMAIADAPKYTLDKLNDNDLAILE